MKQLNSINWLAPYRQQSKVARTAQRERSRHQQVAGRDRWPWMRMLLVSSLIGVSTVACNEPFLIDDAYRLTVVTETTGADAPTSRMLRIAFYGEDADRGLIHEEITKEVASSSTETFDVGPGYYTGGLSRVPNCPHRYSELGPTEFHVEQDYRLEFSVTCHATRIQIATSTSGSDRDQDGYQVTVFGIARSIWVNDSERQTIDITGSGTLKYLNASPVGSLTLFPKIYDVGLTDLAVGCQVSNGDNPKQVTTVLDQTVDISFEVTCGGTSSPTARIDAPTDSSRFPQGQPVAFEGSAEDSEGQVLTDGSLVWTSNLMNGQIGTGTQFTTSDLVVGNHTITLTATDSEGATGTADVGISVDSLASCTGLVPMADTYVRGGSFADSPFGTYTSLDIKGIASLEYARKAYLVFDISALPASFASATLQLTLAGNAGINPREISLYGVIDNDDWDPAILSEESITWTDAPRNVTTSGIAFEGQGTTATDGVRLLATSTLDNTDPPGTTYTFDITEYVKWALGDNPALSALAPAGDSNGHITLLLAHSAEIVGDNGPWFWSREAAEACNRPQLVAQ